MILINDSFWTLTPLYGKSSLNWKRNVLHSNHKSAMREERYQSLKSDHGINNNFTLLKTFEVKCRIYIRSIIKLKKTTICIEYSMETIIELTIKL